MEDKDLTIQRDTNKSKQKEKKVKFEDFGSKHYTCKGRKKWLMEIFQK